MTNPSISSLSGHMSLPMRIHHLSNMARHLLLRQFLSLLQRKARQALQGQDFMMTCHRESGSRETTIKFAMRLWIYTRDWTKCPTKDQSHAILTNRHRIAMSERERSTLEDEIDFQQRNDPVQQHYMVRDEDDGKYNIDC